jgi:transposase
LLEKFQPLAVGVFLGGLSDALSQHIHIILDNYSTLKHPAIKRWLARHPRFELHFTPTGSSWMNLVERFFRDLSQQAILSGSFGNVRQLVDAIMQYLAQHNLNPKRYVWRAKGEEVLARSNELGKQPLAKINVSLLFKRHMTS